MLLSYISFKLSGHYGFFFLYQNYFIYAFILFLGIFSATIFCSYKLFNRSNPKDLLHPLYFPVVFISALSFSFVVLPSLLHIVTSKNIQIFAAIKPVHYSHKYEYGKIRVEPKDKIQFEFLDGEVLHGIRKEQFDELKRGQKVAIYGTLSAYAFHYLYVVPVNEEYMHDKIEQSRSQY